MKVEIEVPVEALREFIGLDPQNAPTHPSIASEAMIFLLMRIGAEALTVGIDSKIKTWVGEEVARLDLKNKKIKALKENQ